MLTIQQVDTQSKSQVHRFVEIPYRLYANCSQWVPPRAVETEVYLNRQKYSFYQHLEGAFFLAVRDGRDVGRIAFFENPEFNETKKQREGRFFFFDCEDDVEAANALFERGFEWARGRQLNKIVGPRNFMPLHGSGILREGFEYPQLMSMTTYNHDYYASFFEAEEFEKEADYLTYHLDTQSTQLPMWVHEMADWVRKKEKLHVHSFSNIEELQPWVPHLLGIQLRILGNQINTHDTKRQSMSMVEIFKIFVNPQLIKAIMLGKEIIGFIVAFPNLSAALQRGQGELDLETSMEMLDTKEIVFNGLTILPQFQLQGLNALLFSEMEKMVRQAGIRRVHIIQINESTTRLWHDLSVMGVQPTQRHRVYRRHL